MAKKDGRICSPDAWCRPTDQLNRQLRHDRGRHAVVERVGTSAMIAEVSKYIPALGAVAAGAVTSPRSCLFFIADRLRETILR